MHRLALLLTCIGFAAALPGESQSPGLAPPAPAPAAKSSAPVVPKQAAKRQAIPADAVREALLDARNIPADRLPFVRWIWIPTANLEDLKAVSQTINLISRASVVRRPPATGTLVRIDLSWYAPTVKDLEEWVQLWENFQFDPSFALNITRDTLKLLTPEQIRTMTVAVRRREQVQRKDGTWVVTRTFFRDVPLGKVDDLVVVRTNPPHLAHSGIELLQAGTLSLAPIVEYRYFVARVLDTVKDRDKVKQKGKEVEQDNPFSIIYGGLYYEFRGIRKSNKDGVSDLDQLLEDFGIAGRGIKFQQLFDQLRSDERAAMYRSRVTGKPRRIVFFAHPGARLTEALPAVWITFDVRKRDAVDSSGHAILNLGDGYVAKAFEVIIVSRNGEPVYSLHNQQGELLEKADADVVADHLVPLPHTNELAGAISCIRCHGDEDGFKSFANDVLKLIDVKRGGVDVFADTARANDAISDTLDRLSGQYSGDATVLLQRVRDDYAKTTLKATGPWQGHDKPLDTVKLSSARIARVYAKARYDLVDAAAALVELGQPAIEGNDPKERERKAQAALRNLLPPDPAAVVNGVVLESPHIAALKVGLKINPSDWDSIKAFALERAWRGKR